MLPMTLALALTLGADPPRTSPPMPHPLAPSLRATSEKEEDRFDQIIQQFILYDTGKLPAAEGKKALQDFRTLPPEAIFALIRGMNKAAEIDHSCPALVIGRRIASQLKTSSDRELLLFARENVGAGVQNSRHMSVIKEVRMTASQRQAALDRQTPPRIIPR